MDSWSKWIFYISICISFDNWFWNFRMRVRPTVDNPDSQFVAMPPTITPASISNPTTEHIEEPTLKKLKKY